MKANPVKLTLDADHWQSRVSGHHCTSNPQRDPGRRLKVVYLIVLYDLSKLHSLLSLHTLRLKLPNPGKVTGHAVELNQMRAKLVTAGSESRWNPSGLPGV